MSILPTEVVAERINQAIADLISIQDSVSRQAIECAQQDAAEQITAIQSLHLSEDDRNQVIRKVLGGLERKAWAYVDPEPTPAESAFVTTYQLVMRMIRQAWN